MIILLFFSFLFFYHYLCHLLPITNTVTLNLCTTTILYSSCAVDIGHLTTLPALLCSGHFYWTTLQYLSYNGWYDWLLAALYVPSIPTSRKLRQMICSPFLVCWFHFHTSSIEISENSNDEPFCCVLPALPCTYWYTSKWIINCILNF